MRRAILLTALGAAWAALTACGPCPATRGSVYPDPPRLDRDEFSVMTFNLYRFGFYDRDDDGQEDDFKPEDQVEALVGILADQQPDVLAVQELGDEASFDILIERLSAAGLDYPHRAYIEGFTPHAKNGLLSRYPIVSTTRWTNLTYTVSETEFGVSRGFLEAEIEVDDDYRFTLFNVHLKSKRYHELGQTEMRRNEARLLTQILTDRLAENPEINLLVAGDLNDTPESAPIRMIIDEGGLTDLRLRDFVGDAWTHEWSFRDAYSRIDYLLCSPGMAAELVEAKSRVVRDPRNRNASDHRAVVAVFRAAEASPK